MTPDDVLRLFEKMLDNLDRWLDKAETHAKERSFEVDVLAQARLAPDQFTLAQQVQSACDQAKYAAAYLGARPAPSYLWSAARPEWPRQHLPVWSATACAPNS